MLNELGNELVVGDVVQIDPESDPIFGGHFLVVTECYSWGVEGYVAPLCEEKERKGLAYYRCEFKNIEYIGSCVWMVGDEENKKDNPE